MFFKEKKIKSNYIIDKIMEYATNDSQKCKLKMILYSKSLQTKLNIDIDQFKYY